MGYDAFLDKLLATLNLPLLRKRRFFEQSVESPSIAHLIKSAALDMPAIIGSGLSTIEVDTSIGAQRLNVNVARFAEDPRFVVIYHRDLNEQDDVLFERIFMEAPFASGATLMSVSPDWYESRAAFQEQIVRLASFMAYLAASVKLTDGLIKSVAPNTKPFIAIAGMGVGGVIANLHHTYRNSATCYVPLLAGNRLADVFLDTCLRVLVAPEARKSEQQIRASLNFDAEFKERNLANVYPLLARHDQYVVHDVQAPAYGGRSIKTILKGHHTAKRAPRVLTEHIASVIDQLQRVRT